MKIKPISVLTAGMTVLGVIRVLARLKNEALLDNLDNDYRHDGIEDPRFEYDIRGVIVGKDGLPKRKKK